jgi:hypothetical protein
LIDPNKEIQEMAKGFQAKIQLSKTKRAPVSHTGFRGRFVKKGDSFITTDPVEVRYYQSQPGFSIAILSGKFTAKPVQEEEIDEDIDERDDEDEVEEEDEERNEEVDGLYEKADLKKMSQKDLKKLIKDDDELPLTLKDIPKKASKNEIIDLILEAQNQSDDDDEEDDEEDDE